MPVGKKSFNPWKAGIALMVGVFLIGTAASLVVAVRRASRVVDTDYYSHGLHYDQTRNGSKNVGLNWNLSASCADGELRVRVQDQAGAPVAGGKLRFESEPGRTGNIGILPLAESAPGVFRAPRPVSPAGELRGTLRFTLGEASASHRLVLFN